MKTKHIFIMVTIYSIIMLTILLCGVGYLLHILKKKTSAEPIEKIEYVYLYQNADSADNFEDISIESEWWIVREYEGQIGIFKSDGTLLQVLDTYIKTLPKADQDLLGEGITVQTKSELNAIIEDYSD